MTMRSWNSLCLRRQYRRNLSSRISWSSRIFRMRRGADSLKMRSRTKINSGNILERMETTTLRRCMVLKMSSRENWRRKLTRARSKKDEGFYSVFMNSIKKGEYLGLSELWKWVWGWHLSLMLEHQLYRIQGSNLYSRHENKVLLLKHSQVQAQQSQLSVPPASPLTISNSLAIYQKQKAKKKTSSFKSKDQAKQQHYMRAPTDWWKLSQAYLISSDQNTWCTLALNWQKGMSNIWEIQLNEWWIISRKPMKARESKVKLL